MPGGTLEFLYEIDAKIDGLVKMLDVVGDSVKALHEMDKATAKAETSIGHVERASHKAADAHGRHGHALWQLGHQYEYAKNGINEFAEAIGLVLAFEAVEKLVDMVKELGTEILNASAKAERTEKSFGLLLGAEGGEQLLSYLKEIHRYTEFTNEGLETTAASLLRVGFEGEGLKRALAASLDIAALPGGSLPEALNAIERVKRTGHVDNRTLGGLGFGEKDFLAQLSKRTGSPMDVLKKQIEAGKGDVAQSLEALYDLIHKRTGKALGDAGVEMGETLQARLTHLKEAPEEIFKAMAGTEAFGHLSDSFGALADDLAPNGRIGSILVANLKGAFTTSADFISEIDWASGFQTAVDLGREFWEVAKGIGSVFEEVVREWNGLKDIVESILTVGHLTDKLGITHLGNRQEREYRDADASPEVQAAKKRQADIHSRLKSFNQGFNQLHAFEGVAAGMPMGLFSGAARYMDHAYAAGELTGQASIDGAKDKLKTHSPSKVFEDLGMLSGEGYVRGLDASTKGIDDAIARSLGATDSVPVGSFARPASGGAGGPIEVTVNITTNVAGAGGGGSQAGDDIGSAVAAQVESILPSALQAAFEKMRLEAGA